MGVSAYRRIGVRGLESFVARTRGGPPEADVRAQARSIFAEIPFSSFTLTNAS